jgi:hypothetical protein
VGADPGGPSVDLFGDRSGLDGTLSPDDDAAEGPATDDAPPPLPAGAPAEVRFRTFQAWLEARSGRYSAISLDFALVSVTPPTLRCVTSHDLHLRHGRGLLEDKRVLRGVAACFPGCSQVAVTLRDGARPLTRRELLKAERAAHIAELREAVAQEEVVQRLTDALSARMVAVTPPDEPPPVARPPGSPEPR